MEGLKKCPFCGGDATPVYYDLPQASGYTSNIFYAGKRGTIKCKKCEVRLPRIYRTVRKASEVWNRRFSDE